MLVLRKLAILLLGLSAFASAFNAEAFWLPPERPSAIELSDLASDWFEPGEGVADQFGSAFAAGDLNGDGYVDHIVGSPGYNSGQAQGRVYVYYGSASGLVHPSPLRFSLTGDNTGYAVYFGGSVASADLNGDGYDDVIAGEYGYTNSTGRVYVYLGAGTGLSATRALTLTGQAQNNQFGFSVARAGDVNGDGYADFLVGAPGYNSGSGRVYLYLGGASLSATPAGDYRGASGGFGKRVAPAGDVDGDGYDDVMIGAPGVVSSPGQAFVYLGSGAGLSASPAITLTGEAAANNFGQSGGAAGDVNGDGYADVMVGASGYSSNLGRAYLYLGSQAGLNAAPALTLTGEATADYFGRSIEWTGDVNGDGYADAMIGADGYSSNLGRAYLYLGSQAGLRATPALTLTGESASGRFGGSVGSAGDVNGDGYADFAVGAPGYNSCQGSITVYHGSAFLPSATPRSVITGDANSRLGVAVTTAGDVNGDGYTDALVGAKGYENDRGLAYLFLGSSAGLGLTPVLTLTGESAGDLFAASVGTAGDVNGDGYADVLIGAEGHAEGRGRAYLFLGISDGLQPTPALTLTGNLAGDYLGASVDTAGDVNGDGYADFVVGAWGANQAFVYYGGTVLRADQSLSLTGENGTDLFGRSTATAGDVNGDGYADVLIGAAGYDSGRGRAYLYLGAGEGLQSTPALTLTGGATGDYFGVSAGSAGDMNADGYAEFVVGAHGAGRAYVYAGGAQPEATPILTLAGDNPGDHFGVSAGTAGDMNGDGYSDIIVGAESDSADRGRAYVYLGGPAGEGAEPALTLSGESASSFFGSTVSTAGDVDADGYADFLVGAYGYGGNQGRTYLYVGNGGGGKAGLAQAERPEDGLPVQPWGLSSQTDGFQVRLAAADPRGRGRIKLQAEICLPGQAFSDPACVVQTSPDWMDVAASPTVTLTITNLEPGTLYRWRSRVLYAPYSVTGGGPPNPEHGPWRRFLAQSQEADVHTAPLYWTYLPFVVR